MNNRRKTDTGIIGLVRRNLGWGSYLILACAFAYSIHLVRAESDTRRTEIVQATQQVIRDSCERGNSTRTLLRDLIDESQEQLKFYVKDGAISQTQFNRAAAANATATSKLKNVDCKKAVSSVVKAGISN